MGWRDVSRFWATRYRLSRAAIKERLETALTINSSQPIAYCQKIVNIFHRMADMQRLSDRIMAHVKGLPEGEPITASSLLHLGKRIAVNHALSRLADSRQLLRADRGIYLCLIKSRFGTRAPSINRVLEALAIQRGEIIVSTGAAAANTLGLTTQVPMRSVFLTSGRSRTMNIGKQVVELRHAPSWQLTLAGRKAGDAVRALAWLGPENADSALKILKRELPPNIFEELATAAPQLPAWLAQSVGMAAYD